MAEIKNHLQVWLCNLWAALKRNVWYDWTHFMDAACSQQTSELSARVNSAHSKRSLITRRWTKTSVKADLYLNIRHCMTAFYLTLRGAASPLSFLEPNSVSGGGGVWMLICEVIAFLCRIANSNICHFVEGADSRGHHLQRSLSLSPTLSVRQWHAKCNMLLLICNNTWLSQINGSYDTCVPEAPLAETQCT